ncbi:MAG: DNA polymerase [Sphaerochaeta sp.]|jgi:DNA polymerase I-like protein with 3'-5' exonuclease and polymerase domains|nr:DNA polymerase [Sphaerochaeta sp.]
MTLLYFGPNTISKQLFREQLINHPPAVIAIDTETISLKERLPIGFAIATSPNEAWWFDNYPNHDPEIELLKDLMTSPLILKAYANVMFDIRVLPLIFQEFNCDMSNIVDVLTLARLLGRTHARVMDLAQEIGREASNAGDMLKEYGAKTMLELPPMEVAAKCANDAMVTLALYHHLQPQADRLFDEGLSPDYLDVERKVIPILVDMSLRGLTIDHDRRELIQDQLEKDKAFYLSVCKDNDIENPGSGMQSGFILAKRGNFLPFTKSRKQYKTDEETLEMADDPLATAVLGYKRATSLLTKYIYPLAGVEKLYTNYGIDTVVGRTTSSNFNMQNIPAAKSRVQYDLRQIFIPDNRVFTTGDFSQEHLRIIMYMSGDKEMQRVYEEGKDGGDIHNSTMKKINRPRAIAKIVNYTIPYGDDPAALARALKTKDLRWCSQLIDEWYGAYPDAAAYLRASKSYALAHGKSTPTLFGRQIAIQEEYKRNGKLNEDAMGRKGVNYPIIGSDGEVMKRALIICEDKGLPLALTVHDSITCDGDIKFPTYELENIAPVHIPFEIEQSDRWK